MKIKYQLFLLFILLSSHLSVGNVTGQLAALEPKALSITGVIEDNYANLSYTFVFDNTASSENKTGFQEITIPDNLFLSNVSASIDDNVYYGIVKEVDQAQQEYEEAVASNKTAILVNSLGGQRYSIELHVRAGKEVKLEIMVEGYNTRKLGMYSLNLIDLPSAPLLDFTVDLNFFTSISTYKTIKLVGLGPATITPLSVKNGYNVKFFQKKYLLSNPVSVSYILSEMLPEGRLLSHNSGTDNFFLYLMAPEIYNIEDQTAREYVFVIDISGSMNTNQRIQRAKDAFTTIIGTLNTKDKFNVISFESFVDFLWETTKEATTDNINEAKTWVNNLIASGSTNIDGALKKGLASFNSYFRAAKALTLLSDGQPTAGETNPSMIRKNARTYNQEEAAIFTIAFGGSSHEGLMASLAYDSGGNFEIVADGTGSTEELLTFYSGFSTPVATGYSISYTNAFDVAPTPETLKGPLFNGSEVVQTGKYVDQLSIQTQVHYNTKTETYQHSIQEASTQLPHVERIWAINQINDLLDLVAVNGSTPELRETIVSIAVTYGIVVEGYTALIIVVDEPEVQDQETITDDEYYPPESGDPVQEAPAAPVTKVVGTVDGLQNTSWLVEFILLGLATILVAYRSKTKRKV